MVAMASEGKEVIQRLRAKLDDLNGHDLNGHMPDEREERSRAHSPDGIADEQQTRRSDEELDSASSLKSLQAEAAARADELARLRREVRRARGNLLVAQRALLERTAQERWVEQQRTQVAHLKHDLEQKRMRIAECGLSSSPGSVAAAVAAADGKSTPQPRSYCPQPRRAPGSAASSCSATAIPTDTAHQSAHSPPPSSSSRKLQPAHRSNGSSSNNHQQGTASPRPPAPSSPSSTSSSRVPGDVGGGKKLGGSAVAAPAGRPGIRSAPCLSGSCSSSSSSKVASGLVTPPVATSPTLSNGPRHLARQLPGTAASGGYQPVNELLTVVREPVAAGEPINGQQTPRRQPPLLHSQSESIPSQRTCLLGKRQGSVGGPSSPSPSRVNSPIASPAAPATTNPSAGRGRRPGMARASRECQLMPQTPNTSQPSSPRLATSRRGAEDRRGQNKPCSPTRGAAAGGGVGGSQAVPSGGRRQHHGGGCSSSAPAFQPLGNTPDLVAERKAKAAAKRRGGPKLLSSKASCGSPRKEAGGGRLGEHRLSNSTTNNGGSTRLSARRSDREGSCAGSVGPTESCNGQAAPELSTSPSSTTSATPLPGGHSLGYRWSLMPVLSKVAVPEAPAEPAVAAQPPPHAMKADPLAESRQHSPTRRQLWVERAEETISSRGPSPCPWLGPAQRQPPATATAGAAGIGFAFALDQERTSSPSPCMSRPAGQSSSYSSLWPASAAVERELTPLNMVLRRQSACASLGYSHQQQQVAASLASAAVERFASTGTSPTRGRSLSRDVALTSLPRFVYMEPVTATCAVGYNATAHAMPPSSRVAWSPPRNE